MFNGRHIGARCFRMRDLQRLCVDVHLSSSDIFNQVFHEKKVKITIASAT
jgi:hypothetical protein